MSRLVLLLPAALLCLAAAPAPKAPPAKTPPAKSAPAKTGPAKATAAKPAAAPAKTPAGDFDATNPQGLMTILGEAGAKVQTNRREDDAVFIAVTSNVANFSMQFAGCSPQGRACRAVLLDRPMGPTGITGAQVNAFNQTSVMCRLYQDRGGQAHVVYSAILFRTMTRDDAVTHMTAWQGCLADSLDFAKDPVAYLANAA